MAQSWRVARDSPNRNTPALDAAALDRLALAYVARYATTRAKLAAYLHRKLTERGWAGEGAADVGAIVDRMAALGYVDDRAFAEARGAALTRRGYGTRRIALALQLAGIERDDATPAMEAASENAEDAAIAFARRKRIGPFAREAQGPDQRRRALAAMLRAGHPAAIARRVVNCTDPAQLSEK